MEWPVCSILQALSLHFPSSLFPHVPVVLALSSLLCSAHPDIAFPWPPAPWADQNVLSTVSPYPKTLGGEAVV